MTTKIALFLSLIAALPASAEPIIITLDNAAQLGVAGRTLTFFGSLQNTTATEQFFTSANLNTAPELIGDPSPFFLNGLLFLSPNFSLFPFQTSPSFALFDIFIPPGTTPGTYSLNHDFTLLGGPVSGDQDPLGSTAFSVVVEEAPAVPEPGTFLVVLPALALIYHRTRRRANVP